MLPVCLMGTPLDVVEIGQTLGYPSSELIVENVTATERRIYSLPTIVEHQKRQKPPVDPARIISAYRITSRVPSTFFPILVTIAEEGALLSEETRNLIGNLAALPDRPVNKGGRGSLGHLAVDDQGAGGLFVAKVRVPSSTEGMEYPQHDMGTVSEVRFPAKGIDVRIAMIFNFELLPMKGGERYYERFGPPGELPATPAFDWAEGFRALNRTVLKTGTSKTSKLARFTWVVVAIGTTIACLLWLKMRRCSR
jgi:hypothetical protein